MADALNRALLAGMSLSDIQKLNKEGAYMEEIAAAAERVQENGEDVGGIRPGDFSDVGNAAKFQALNKGRLMYTDSRGWLCWDGIKWTADDHQAMKNAVEMSDKMLEDAQAAYVAAVGNHTSFKLYDDDQERVARAAAEVKKEKAYLEHAKRTRADRRIKAILELAKHFFAIDPAKLDANPAELNTPKGIVNLVTGEIRPCDKTAMCTKVTACGPGTAGAEMWINFLESVTGGLNLGAFGL